MEKRNIIFLILMAILVVILVIGFGKVCKRAVSVEEAKSSDFVGKYKLADPARSFDQYHGEVEFKKDGTFESIELLRKETKKVEGKGIWSFDEKTKVFVIDWRPGGRFEGRVAGDTRDFTIDGHWSNGKAGRLRIYK